MRRVKFSAADSPVLPRSSSSNGYPRGKPDRNRVFRQLLLIGFTIAAVYCIARVVRGRNGSPGTESKAGLSHEDDTHLAADGLHPAKDHSNGTPDHHQEVIDAQHSKHLGNHLESGTHHQDPHEQHQAVPHTADDGSIVINSATQHPSNGSGQPSLPPAHSVSSGASSHPTQHASAPGTQAAQQHLPREADVLPDWSGEAAAAPHQHPAGHAVVPDPHAAPLGVYALSAADIDGKERHLSEFAGKVTLIVNVATHCGFTDSNYKGLQEAYNKYHQHGLEILAFPCNQFGNQEPDSEQQIKSWAQQTYNVTFPLFSKVDVNGPNAHPVFKYLRRQLPVDQGGGEGIDPGHDFVWNFQKVLVNRHGQPVKLIHQDWHQGIVEHAIYDLLMSEQ